MQLMGHDYCTLLTAAQILAGAFGTATERNGDNWGRTPRKATNTQRV